MIIGTEGSQGHGYRVGNGGSLMGACWRAKDCLGETVGERLRPVRSREMIMPFTTPTAWLYGRTDYGLAKGRNGWRNGYGAFLVLGSLVISCLRVGYFAFYTFCITHYSNR